MAENENINPEVTPDQAPEAEAKGKPAKEPKEKKGKQKPGDWEAKLAAAEAKLTDAEQKAGELQNTLMRTAAEYDNYRKRTQKEQEASFNNGVCHAAQQLLPIIDTLEAAANAQTTDEEYKKGVVLTLAKCEEVFKKLNICEIEAMGQQFDPELHNAVMQEECEGAECGAVTRVMQKGYIQNGKVIRHSMVAVQP